MRLFLFVGLLLFAPLGLYYLRLARRGLRAITRIVALRTRRVAEIAEGPVELAGTIRAIDGRPIVAPSGQRCVHVEVRIEGYSHAGKNRTRLHSEGETRLVPAELVDETGASVRIDLENVDVLGKRRSIHGAPRVLHEATKSWTKTVSPAAGHLEIIETGLRHGATVVLSGHARVVDAKVEKGESGYRDGAPVEKKTFVVSGTDEERILVVEGTEAKLLWEASWPVAVLVISAAFALAFAATLFALIIA